MAWPGKARLLAFGVLERSTAPSWALQLQIIIISGCGMPAANGGLVLLDF
jgi:hypothetical protein